MMNRYYVGLAATMHDPALAILDPAGEIVFAEATERPTQRKRAYNTPPDDMTRVHELIAAHCRDADEIVAAVSWSAGYLAMLNVMSATTSPFSPAADDDAIWPLPAAPALITTMRNSVSQAALNLSSSRRVGVPVTVRYYDHHLTHAAAGVRTSPFERAAIAVVDGFGEAGAAAFYECEAGRITEIADNATHAGISLGPAASLGHFYSRLCALCGFDPLQGEEWKVMGLAAYGRHDAAAAALLRGALAVRGLSLVPGAAGEDAVRRLRALGAGRRRSFASPRDAADLAHTGQAVFEEILIALLRNLHARTRCDALILAGGCALNSSCNGKILAKTPFGRLHVPPAPADDGTAIGAAFLAYREDHPDAPHVPRLASPYLGSTLSEGTTRNLRAFSGLPITVCRAGEAPARAADLLAEGKIIGWIQGRAEFGPRALGNRSILADPRPADMKDRINARVKFREEFRPLAPSILPEHGAAYFLDYQDAPYMERTLRFRAPARRLVPAVVHEDGTGRLQSVRRDWNPRYYDLIAAFWARTGVPLVLNTSYNVMGKPIAHAVEDVLGAFFTTGLDAVFLGDLLIEKPGASETGATSAAATTPARSSSRTSSAKRRRGRRGGSRSSTAGTTQPRRVR